MKSYILIPILLMIYTIAMAIYGWDKYVGSRTEFITIVIACIGINILLFFLLRRRAKFRQELKEMNRKFAEEKKEKAAPSKK